MSRALLSRVAESIFWMGRYIERVEGTARILDVVVHHVLERCGSDAEDMASRVAGAMGVACQDDMDFWQVTDKLCFEKQTQSSIAGSFTAARDNARSVRYLLPSELWERLNVAWVELPMRRSWAGRSGPGVFLSWVKDQAAAVSGLADTMMSRDQTWLFFALGRSLERADLTARLLAALPLDRLTESGLMTLLRSCGGHEVYMRQASGVIELEGVIDFLMRDLLFPRSALRSLNIASEAIVDLGYNNQDVWNEARSVIGLARAELEFSHPEEILADIPIKLARLHSACSKASSLITDSYLQHEAPTEWRQGAGR